MKKVATFKEFINESFHMPDGTTIGVDHLHRPVSKITEEDSNNIIICV